MTITEDYLDMATITVADIALTYPQALEILNRYNLDYCCGGKKLFVRACEKAGLKAEAIWQEIQSAKANYGSGNLIRFDTWDTPLLIDFIVQHHHQYIREAIPQIRQLLDKVCQAHGEDTPFLFIVRKEFNDLAAELLEHMPKEEEVLFPSIRELFNQTNSCEINRVPKQLSAPLTSFEDEHEVAGHLIKSIRIATDNYTPPDHACPTFRMTYIMLNQFDNDLTQHIHLENNILFPAARKK